MENSSGVESDSSQQVLELQQKVAKLENDFQGACRIAREAQLRVEFLEDILDQKPIVNVVEEENQMDVLQKNCEILRLDDPSSQIMEEAGRDATSREQQLQGRVDILTRQLEVERSISAENQRISCERIDDLTHKLALYGGVTSPPEANILLACEPGAEGTISYESAVEYLQPKYHLNNKQWYRIYKKVWADEIPYCEVCDIKIHNLDYLQHFISSAHSWKIRHENICAVPLAAFEYWMIKLESIQLPDSDVALKRIEDHQAKYAPVRIETPRKNAAKRAVHSENILELYGSRTPGTIAFAKAQMALRSRWHEEDLDWLKNLNETLNDKRFECKGCNMKLTRNRILFHFFSAKHYRLVRKLNMAISLVAFEFWMRKLESIPQSYAVTMTGVSGESAKMEDEDEMEE